MISTKTRNPEKPLPSIIIRYDIEKGQTFRNLFFLDDGYFILETCKTTDADGVQVITLTYTLYSIFIHFDHEAFSQSTPYHQFEIGFKASQKKPESLSLIEKGSSSILFEGPLPQVMIQKFGHQVYFALKSSQGYILSYNLENYSFDQTFKLDLGSPILDLKIARPENEDNAMFYVLTNKREFFVVEKGKKLESRSVELGEKDIENNFLSHLFGSYVIEGKTVEYLIINRGSILQVIYLNPMEIRTIHLSKLISLENYIGWYAYEEKLCLLTLQSTIVMIDLKEKKTLDNCKTLPFTCFDDPSRKTPADFSSLIGPIFFFNHSHFVVILLDDYSKFTVKFYSLPALIYKQNTLDGYFKIINITTEYDLDELIPRCKDGFAQDQILKIQGNVFLLKFPVMNLYFDLELYSPRLTVYCAKVHLDTPLNAKWEKMETNVEKKEPLKKQWGRRIPQNKNRVIGEETKDGEEERPKRATSLEKIKHEKEQTKRLICDMRKNMQDGHVREEKKKFLREHNKEKNKKLYNRRKGSLTNLTNWS